MPAGSLDLGLAEFDVLLGDRIVFLLGELLGHRARVLLRDVIEAGVGARHELDFDSDGLRHGNLENIAPEMARQTTAHARNVKEWHRRSGLSFNVRHWHPSIASARALDWRQHGTPRDLGGIMLRTIAAVLAVSPLALALMHAA